MTLTTFGTFQPITPAQVLSSQPVAQQVAQQTSQAPIQAPKDPQQKNPVPRDFVARGLSPLIPLPNIVRIEVLNKAARQRYLGTIQQTVNTNKDALAEQLHRNNLDKFYGFTSGSGKKIIKFGATWSPLNNSGGIVDNVRAAVAGGGFKIGGENIGDLLRDFTGINVSSTGSSTLKRFQGNTLETFNIDCGWYLPEQHDLCIKSLKSILSMIYPTQATGLTFAKLLNQIVSNVKGVGTDIARTFGDNSPVTGGVNGATTAFQPTADALTQTANSLPAGTSTADTVQANNKANDANSAAAANTSANIPDNTKRALNDNKTANTNFQNKSDIDSVSNLLGLSLTFDPFPVRCSIGQYIDIEPLVITSAGIDFSSETFINSDGRHLPIFCTVHIEFDFWMNPKPSLQFLSLFGTEMFGDNS